jgi:H+/Cl- antiporter ClcA
VILYQREKGIALAQALPPLAAAAGAYAALYAIQGEAAGWGTIPAAKDLQLDDFFTALVLGALAVLVAVLLRWALARCAGLAERVDRTMPWTVSAALFGTVLGGLYLAGGESVQFSGSEGIGILLREQADEGALVFAGLIAVKLLVTAWSLAIGYRGGLIFPSIYGGVAMTLLVGTIAEGLAGPGAMIGAISGLLVAMTQPVVALVMVAALLPGELMGLAVAGVLGAVIAQRVAARVTRGRVTGDPAT